ncbi:MAG: hypothetical protein WC437_04985 [Patescibacteria group bacterium]
MALTQDETIRTAQRTKAMEMVRLAHEICELDATRVDEEGNALYTSCAPDCPMLYKGKCLKDGINANAKALYNE